MTVRFGLLGAGRIGKVHAKAVTGDPKAKLVAVADAFPAAAQAIADQYGCDVRSIDAICASADIDAVVICTPTDTHADLIERFVKAGKAVFCEKPIDLDLERALKVRATVAAGGKPVMMGFNRRFDPNFAALKAAFVAGEIGKGELLSVTSYDPAPPPVSYVKVSGGLFRDMMIHDFDMCCWLFGLPEKVTATGSCLVDPAIGEAGDVDTAVVILHYADGRIATIRNSRRAVFGYDQRLELLGSDGLLSVENQLETTLSKSTASHVSSAKPQLFFLERYMRAYETEWAGFLDALTSDTEMPATVQDGVNALALAEAANISHREGRTVAITAQMVGAAS